MIQLKERKEMDEAFKKAQKPWAKFLQKVERTRLEYHTACKQERTAQNQERNAGGDSSLSPDQVCVNVLKLTQSICIKSCLHRASRIYGVRLTTCLIPSAYYLIICQ